MEREPRSEASSSGGRMALAFATGACCVAALALAFSLGRHWPLSVPVESDAGVPSLSEVRRRGAIPFAELAIDRGTEPDKSTRAPAAADVKDAKRTTGDSR